MIRIVIIVHRDDPPLTDLRYMAAPIADAWKAMGHDVVIVSGPQESADGDIAMLHVNVTVVPDDHVQFAQRFPVTINGRVADISKRFISRHLVRQDDGYEGPVIVKTNLNSGGRREAMLGARRSPEQRANRAMQHQLPWAYRTVMSIDEYRVYDTVDQVPEPVWSNECLVVEKFFAEVHDGLYALRTWIFLGDKETNTIGYSHDKIINANNTVRWENAPVPEDLREKREELGFGYGKFHYVVVDGRTILFDANRTATFGSSRPLEHYIERGRMLAEGLESFL